MSVIIADAIFPKLAGSVQLESVVSGRAATASTDVVRTADFTSIIPAVTTMSYVFSAGTNLNIATVDAKFVLLGDTLLTTAFPTMTLSAGGYGETYILGTPASVVASTLCPSATTPTTIIQELGDGSTYMSVCLFYADGTVRLLWNSGASVWSTEAVTQYGWCYHRHK